MPQQRNLLLRRPNLLRYPGTLPGVDWSHPASSGLGTSGVSLGGQFYNVGTGAPIPMFINSTNFSSKIDAIVGPGQFSTVNTQYYSIPQPSASTSSYTVAAIFTWAGPQVAAYGSIASLNNAALGLFVHTSSLIFYVGGDQNLGAPNFVGGECYFVAVSGNSSAAKTYTVATNLRTGQVYSTTIANFGSLSSSQAMGVCSDSAAELLAGQTSAFMISTASLSSAQLRQWAQDPWSFWYPQKIDPADLLSIIPAVVAGPSAAGLLQTRSRPGLGPRSRHTALLNAALPTQVVAPSVTGGTLPFMGVG